MIHLCLSAAGNGTRFGSNKLLADFRGRPLWTYGYRVLAEVAAECGAEVHVVTRYSEILDAVGKHGVNSPESEKGLSFTVRAACRACGEVREDDRILFLAADQPNVTATTVRRLLEVVLSDRLDGAFPLAACAWDGETSGNPVVFAGVLVPKLMNLTGEQGGKAVLRGYPNRTAHVLCDPEELTDIDFPADLHE